MEQSKQSILVRAGILLIIATGIGGWYYWTNVFDNPGRVFDNMLTTVLSSPSVTKQITQTEGEQSLNQTLQLTTEPTAQAHGRNVLDQGAGTVIITESIGAQKADYVRYNSIKTEQKNDQGKDFDFGRVLNLWGKVTTDQTTGSAPQLYNQTVLGVVPMANLSLSQRQQLIAQIKKDEVYKVDFSKAQRQRVDGRYVYTYPVTLDPVTYIKMLKTFSAQLGMHQLDNVSVEDYAGSPALGFAFTVDILSGQLTKIVYVNPEDPTHPNRIETYSAYGARVVVPEPRDYIGLTDLQTRLQQVQ